MRWWYNVGPIHYFIIAAIFAFIFVVASNEKPTINQQPRKEAPTHRLQDGMSYH